MYHGKTAVATMFLLVPMTATAQNVALDLVTGSHPGPYLGSITDPDFTTGDQFILWSVIHTDTPLDAIDYRLHVNGDADNDKFNLVGYAPGPLSGWEIYIGLPAGGLDGYGDAFAISPSTTAFDYVGYDKKAPGSLDAIAGSELISSATGPISGLEGKTLVGYIIEANANFTPGVYEFSALGSTGSTSTAEWSSAPATGQITEGDSFVLTVVPEPSSALLLLAAAVFLRRRRS